MEQTGKEYLVKGRLKNYSSVSPLTEKETRCLGIPSAKCPAFGTFADRLCEVIFVRSLNIPS